MVRKVPCDKCRGNKYVSVKTADANDKSITCPDCGGEGYKIEIGLSVTPRR